jgi:UDP-2,3-diacylglucosamine pyrophosphatase LpxH
MQVIREITSFLSSGTMVYYVTGNHDEMLRRFTGFKIANFEIVNKIVLNLPTGRAWIFHGDVFDTTMRHSKWLAKLGGKGYDILIMLNTFMNWVSEKLGRGRISLSKKIKNSVKGVVSFVSNFELTAAELAIANGYDYVICGHIHQPEIKEIQTKSGEKVMYLNSGDWVENSTALEYHDGVWKLYFEDQSPQKNIKSELIKSRREELSIEVLLAEITQNVVKV